MTVRTRTSGETVGEAPPTAPRRLSPRLVAAAAAVLVVLQLALRGWVAGKGFFYWDDLILTARSASFPLLSPHFLLYNHDGHLMPGAFLLAGIATKLAPLQWILPAVMLVALQALASLSVLRVLRLLLGWRPALLVPLAFYLFSPLTVPAFAWWAAALNALPLQIGLAWVAGDALQLHRTGRRRHVVTGAVVFAGSLAFFEKSILVPVVAFAVVALAVRMDGVRQPWVTARRRCAPLWTASAIVAAVWAVVYATVVNTHLTFSSPGKMLGLLNHATSMGLLPTLAGGPWMWDRWPPSPPWAEPPGVLIALGWLVFGATVACTLWRRRHVGAVWLCTVAYVLVSDAAMILMRSGPNTSLELAQTLRYLTDSAVIVTLALALILRAPRREPRPVPWPSPRVRAATGAACAVAFLAGSLASTVTFVGRWSDNPTVDYLRTAERALASHRDVPLLDQPVSLSVLLPVAHPFNMASNVFAPLPDRPPFAASTPRLRMLDDAGSLIDAHVAPARHIVQGPVAGCGYRAAGRDVPLIGNTSADLRLDGPMTGWDWTARLNYLADSDGTIAVSFPGSDPVTVPVRRGMHAVYVRLTGGGSTLAGTQSVPRRRTGRRRRARRGALR